MKQEKTVSRFASDKDVTGKLDVGVLFYKLPNDNCAAMRYKWDDEFGFHSPEVLSKQHVVDACVHMKDADASMEYIHERVVLHGTGYFAFWTPRKRRRIRVNKVKRKTYIHPPLLIMVKDYQMSVHELALNKRPTLNSYLHVSRYHGIDVHGSMVGQCNVKIPDTMDPIPEPWEDAFFSSKFNCMPYSERQRRCGRLEDLIYHDLD